MSEDDAGVDKTDINFDITFSCDCGATASVSFSADHDVEFENPETGDSELENIHEVIG